MNKYQEALNNVKIAPSFMGGNTKYSTHLNSATLFLEDISTLQELVDKEKPYTLEEVKKEWEEEGYIVEESKYGYNIFKNNKFKVKIAYITKTKPTCRLFVIANYELLELINKTFKALG